MIPSKKQTTLPPGVEVKTLDQVQLGESTTTLVHGDSKSGKTFFLGTAGSRSLYIYFTVGEGISTLQSPAFRDKYRNYNPITVAIEEHSTAAAFDAVGRTIDYMVDTRREEFDIVIVDEMTAFRRAAMRKGLELSNIEGRSKTEEKLNQAGRPPGFFFPAIQDYGAEMNLVEWWTATYTDDAKKQGYHLLVAAHSRNIYEKLGNRPNDPEVLVKVKPGFTGKTFPDDITAYYDNVFYMQRSGKGTNAQHKLIIHGDETYLAGTRYGGVFRDDKGREVSSITNPDFLKMLKSIQESGIKPGGKLV